MQRGGELKQNRFIAFGAGLACQMKRPALTAIGVELPVDGAAKRGAAVASHTLPRCRAAPDRRRLLGRALRLKVCVLLAAKVGRHRRVERFPAPEAMAGTDQVSPHGDASLRSILNWS